MEDGPAAVVNSILTNEIPNCRLSTYVFPRPETVKKDLYYPVLAEHLDKFAEQILLSLSVDETQIVVGGDHSISFASLSAVLRRRASDDVSVGVIMFDSHGDLHNLASTPSGNFHAMWLRPFLDLFDESNIASIVGGRLSAQDVLYIGNLVLEPEEQDFIQTNGIENITRAELESDMDNAQKRLARFVEKHAHIHVSFDIDVFNKDIVFATGTPNPDGLFKEDVFPLLDILNRVDRKSIDLVEVNPRKTGADLTVNLAQAVLKTLLTNATATSGN